MATPRINVITPCFNQARFIEHTICSVLDQSYENLEYIIIDGGSTDRSGAIIKLYEEHLAYWISKPCRGQSDAINRGLAHTTGDFVAVLNANEVYLPGALEQIATAGGGKNAPAWIVGHCLRIGEDDEPFGLLKSRAPETLASFLMHDTGYLPAPETFVCSRWLNSNSCYDPNLDFAFHYEYCCRMLSQVGSPKIIGQALAASRDLGRARSAVKTVRDGLEHLKAAQRYAGMLPLSQRYELWANCDRRHRIYTLAQAEVAGEKAKRFLLNVLIRRPWWLADDTIRRTLLHGVSHPLPPEMARPAA